MLLARYNGHHKDIRNRCSLRRFETKEVRARNQPKARARGIHIGGWSVTMGLIEP